MAITLRTRRGSDHPTAKLNEAAARRILELAAAGVSISEICREFSYVSRPTIYAVIRRRVWRHIEIDSRDLASEDASEKGRAAVRD